MNNVVTVLFALVASGFGVMVAANAAVIVARLLHRDSFANRLLMVTSRVVWPLRIGGRGGPN